MGSFGSLATKLHKASKAVLTNTDRLVLTLASDILRNIVADTPIDTGAAKSNWIVSINAPSADTRDPYVPGKAGSTALANIITTVEMGNQVLSAYMSGDIIHITNNLDYITGLNDGSISRQAPPDYVQKAILGCIAKIQGAGFSIMQNIEV